MAPAIRHLMLQPVSTTEHQVKQAIVSEIAENELGRGYRVEKQSGRRKVLSRLPERFWERLLQSREAVLDLEQAVILSQTL